MSPCQGKVINYWKGISVATDTVQRMFLFLQYNSWNARTSCCSLTLLDYSLHIIQLMLFICGFPPGAQFTNIDRVFDPRMQK